MTSGVEMPRSAVIILLVGSGVVSARSAAVCAPHLVLARYFAVSSARCPSGMCLPWLPFFVEGGGRVSLPQHLESHPLAAEVEFLAEPR